MRKKRSSEKYTQFCVSNFRYVEKYSFPNVIINPLKLKFNKKTVHFFKIKKGSEPLKTYSRSPNIFTCGYKIFINSHAILN